MKLVVMLLVSWWAFAAYADEPLPNGNTEWERRLGVIEWRVSKHIDGKEKMTSGFAKLPPHLRQIACDAYPVTSDRDLIRDLKIEIADLQGESNVSQLNAAQLARLSAQQNKVATLTTGIDCARLESSTPSGIPAKVLESPPPAFPPAAKQAGHHGTVLVQLTVLVDGQIADISLAQSSRSKELDEAALTAVEKWKFAPAMDADGKPLVSKVRVPFRFQQANSIDLSKTLCKEFVAETRWFQQTFPEQKLSDMALYKRTFGFFAVRGGSKLAPLQTYAGAYAKTITACEAAPDEKFLPVLIANAQ